MDERRPIDPESSMCCIAQAHPHTSGGCGSLAKHTQYSCYGIRRSRYIQDSNTVAEHFWLPIGQTRFERFAELDWSVFPWPKDGGPCWAAVTPGGPRLLLSSPLHITVVLIESTMSAIFEEKISIEAQIWSNITFSHQPKIISIWTFLA
jgi:hypothetical protein